MAEVSQSGWHVIGILIDKHKEACSESGCVAKFWKQEDRISALMIHVLGKCVESSLHGSEEAAIRSLTAMPEALDLFIEAANYEVERDKEKEAKESEEKT